MSAVVDSLTVITPELPSGVTFLHWETVAGRKYIKLAKSDPKIVRLITNHGHGNERALAHTNIIEELIKLRNECRSKLVEENKHSAAVAAGQSKEDLGIDAEPPAKKSKALDVALPEVIDVQTPGREGVDPIVMSVMLGSPTAPLWMELSTQNVDFIRKYAAADIEAGDTKRSRGKERPEDEKIVSPSPNVVWAWDRGSFRARVKCDDGRVKFKDFKPESMSSEDVSLAGASAARFVTSHRDF